jgi:CDP-4-dehydro-6-deoxyglucose reductase, E1
MTSAYPLATSSWGEEEVEAIQQVISSGMFTMGARVKEFEAAFAAYTGSRYCVMVNSGSSANLLMVGALRYRKRGGLVPGDEIIVPAVSWPTTYYPLQQYGLRVKFVDIDRDTLNYDLGSLAGAIGERTRAIMVVNLLGNPNDFGQLRALTRGRDIALLEDNCESLGATFQGRQAGTFGVMGTYSAFFSHHISTMEGGMIVTEDEELHHLLVALRAHGWTRDLPKVNQVCGVKGDDPFEESFRFVLPGYNVRPLEFSGAVGVEQLKRLPGMIAARRSNAGAFLDLMACYPHLRPQRELGKSSWFGFSMVVEPGAPFTRRDVVAALTRLGVESRPIVAGNFAKNEVMRWFDHEIHGALPNAEEIDRAGLFVGNHHYPLQRELDVLRQALDTLPRG